MKKLALMALAAILISLTAPAQLSPDRKMRMVQGLIDTYYVDTVNSDKIAEAAIVAMLGTLDPHSVYSNAEETKALTEPLQGNFSGIGIQFNMLQDSLYVIQTIAGGPSEQVGVRAGDRIIAANDTAISGVKMSNADIIKRLRGPKGSVVNIEVVRRGEQSPIHFRHRARRHTAVQRRRRLHGDTHHRLHTHIALRCRHPQGVRKGIQHPAQARDARPDNRP